MCFYTLALYLDIRFTFAYFVWIFFDLIFYIAQLIIIVSFKANALGNGKKPAFAMSRYNQVLIVEVENGFFCQFPFPKCYAINLFVLV
jgi:hypothetical protein